MARGTTVVLQEHDHSCFLTFLTQLYSFIFKSGSIVSDRCHISPATVTNYSFYISMFSSTALVMSDYMFNLILTIRLVFCCKTVVVMVILYDDAVTGRRLLVK